MHNDADLQRRIVEFEREQEQAAVPPLSLIHIFIAKQEQFIRDQVTKANTGSVSIAGGKEAPKVSELHKCVACGTGLSRRSSTKKKGKLWLGCGNYPNCNPT